MPSYVFVILAGGSSSRFGKKKELVKIDGKHNALSMLVDLVNQSSLITHVHFVYHPDYHQDIRSQAHSSTKKTSFSIAGRTRQESVYNALISLSPLQPDYVLIHDAARPWVSLNLIEEICKQLPQKCAIVPGLPVTDSVKFVEDDLIEKTLPRQQLMFVQTPQGFKFEQIYAAHTQLHAQHQICTDDAEVWEICQKGSIFIIPGELKNRKITYKEDLL